MTMTLREVEAISNGLRHDPRWKLVERIVATPSFAKSSRLSSLLLFVVKESLQGRTEELCEQLIGERVFGRPAGYDSRDDNIVRSHASRLRQRLEAYFREDAPTENLRLTIPRGSYAPVFERIEASLQPGSAAAGMVPPHQPDVSGPALAPSPIRRRHWYLLVGSLCLLLLAALGTRLLTSPAPSHAAMRSSNTLHRFWAAMFSSNRDTLVVPGDSSLVLLKSFTHRSVGIADYSNGQYSSNIACAVPCDPRMLQSLAKRRYTSIADLKFAVAVAQLPESSANRTEIRYARDLQLEDLKEKNLILIGSPEADPWLELLQPQMNFILEDDATKGPRKIINRRPEPGEPSEYSYEEQAATHRGYATIAFLSNLSGDGNVLVVQGFTFAGTQAAAEFITNGKDFEALLTPIVANRPVFPHFEVLLGTRDLNGVASNPTVLAYRVH